MRVDAYNHFKRVPSADMTKSMVKIISEDLDAGNESKAGNTVRKDIRTQEAVDAIISVESVAYVVKTLFPGMNGISAFRDIFISKDLKVFKNLPSEHKKMLHTLHLLFPSWRQKTVIENKIKTYLKVQYPYKHVNLNMNMTKPLDDGSFTWINYQVSDRSTYYRKYLTTQIKHFEQTCAYADGSTIAINDNVANVQYIIDLDNTKNEFLKKGKQGNQQGNLIPIDYREKETVVFSKSELVRAAEQMDSMEDELGIVATDKKHWKKRIENILFMEPNGAKLVDTETMTIEGTQHWIGKLSVGKSTIMDVIAFHMAKMNKHTVLVVNSITDALAKVDYFNRLGITTVPLLSYQNRGKHLSNYLSSLGECDINVYQNKSFYYLSNTCVLKGLDRQTETEYIPFKEFPCHILKDEKFTAKSKSCPYIMKCPCYNVFHDMDKANIFVTTPQSMVDVHIPKPFVKENMTYLEYLIRKADVIFIDESDRVQDTLDKIFASNVSLIDKDGGWVNRTLARFFRESAKTAELMDNEYIMLWINDLHVASMLLNRISNFLATDDYRNIIRKVKRINFSGYKLWESLATKISGIVKARNSKNETEIDEATIIHKALIDYYEQFKHTFNLDDYSEQKSRELCEIAGNVTNPEKLKKDIEKFVQNDIDTIIRQELKRKDVKNAKFSSLGNSIEDIGVWIYFIMTIALLEIKLNSIFNILPDIRAMAPHLLGDSDPINRISNEYDGLIPLPPVNARHGFYFNDSNGEVALQLYRYAGVGRYMLYKLPELYEQIDEHKGAHCVLLSGTSFAPGSPKYNIDLPVRYLLKPANETVQKISYKFLDVHSEKISGVSDSSEKNKTYTALIHNISETDELFGSGSEMDKIMNELDENRKRILMVVGSYKDSEYVSNTINSQNAILKSTSLTNGENTNSNLDPEDDSAVNRSKVHTFAQLGKPILVAPLMAMERGHNILTEQLDEEFDRGKVAAFGATIFLSRPYYVPDDFGLLINRVNSWYMDFIKDDNGRSGLTLKEEVNNLLKTAYQEIDIFNKASLGYETLKPEERDRLLTDTFVNTWQLEGRLIRGGVDAKVYFADSSFAPKTKSGIDNDTVATSMLLGWKYLWSGILDNPFEDLKKTILRELYSIRLDGLKQINVAE